MRLSEPDPEFPHSAVEFASFFADKVSRIRAVTFNAPLPVYAAAQPSTLACFELRTEEAVAQLVMKSPSKHSQADPIPTWLLKDCLHLLQSFLTCLINSSIINCTVPECMKMAIVTPILKKPNLDPSDISNFRPISNLSFLSKLLERAICRQLTAYLESGSLLPQHQSAY